MYFNITLVVANNVVVLYMAMYTLLQTLMNATRIMEVAVKFATTHLVATNVLVKKVTYWT